MRGVTFLAVILLLGLTLTAVALSWRKPLSQNTLPPEIVAATDAVRPDAKNRVPVLVELFTSEGCSSCPPADAVLQTLEQTQPVEGVEVIPLSLHVDYWNDLGWADPYSDAAYSARQSDYSDAFGSNRVYTPQMIVDGRAEFVGSRADRARQAIAEAARTPKAVIVLEKSSANKSPAFGLNIKIDHMPAVTTGDTAEVWLAVTESGLASQVARGENSGRRLTHTAVTRTLQRLGTITDGTFTATPSLSLNDKWQRDQLRAVVFVQETRNRRVLGAASLMMNDE